MTSTSSLQQRGHLLELRTRAWLLQLGAKFVSEPIIGENARADILVVEPFPLVIELLAQTSGHALRMKWKRFLDLRLRLATQLGPHVPFIVISEQGDQESLPFADAVYSESTLPTLKQLSSVRVNPVFLSLFQSGTPSLVHLTDTDDYAQIWSHAVTWEALWASGSNFSPGTMAHRISQRAAEFAQKENRHSSQRSELTFLSRNWIQYVKKVADEALKTHVGGRSTQVTVDLTSIGDRRIRHDAWSSPALGTVVISFRIFSELSLIHKAQEWSVDARLLVASGQTRPGGLVLVPILRQGVQFDLHFLRAINELEAAGWRVFPSDFDQETPAFIGYLRDLARGGM